MPDDQEVPSPGTPDDPARDLPEGPLGELMVGLLRRLARRGRVEFDKATSEGRHRLELRQMQRDRDAFWSRLGKTAYRLVESGEVEHPALRKAMERIDELERRIAELEKDGAPR